MVEERYAACISACNACAEACDDCASKCLSESDVKQMTRCIALDVDCAEICRLNAGFLARESDFATEVCRLSAAICEACAAECVKHSREHCRVCAKACKECAVECRRLCGGAHPQSRAA